LLYADHEHWIIGFRLSRWFISDIDSALRSSHHVDVVSVADVSEVHAASIFRDETENGGMCISETSTTLYTMTRYKMSRADMNIELCCASFFFISFKIELKKNIN
jgi:hypothetical protein